MAKSENRIWATTGLSALMLVLGYLFYLYDESFVTLILLFVGVVLALIVGSNLHGKK